MCSRSRSAALALVSVAIAIAIAGCGGEQKTLPAVATSVEPACASNAAAAAVTVHGTMPIEPNVSMYNDTSTLHVDYRLWLGEVELTDVRWVDASTVTATVPAGIPAGTYALVVESPFGERSTLDGAFRVAAGACNPTGAALEVTVEARPVTLNVGQQVAVSAVVRNSGDGPVAGVTIAATAPPSFTVFTNPNDPVDLAPGQSRTFTWTYTATAGAGHGTFGITATGQDTLNARQLTSAAVESNAVAVLYSVGGSVTGLEGTGLVLRLNGTTDLGVNANAPFTFGSLPSGSAFTVEIVTQPTNPAQTCNVSGASGTVGTGAVTSIIVNCAVNTFTVGGGVTGLAGSGLVLREAVSGQTAAVTSAGTYAFATPIRSGRQYNVTVQTQPSGPTQTCTVQNGTGTVVSANVTNVNVVCQTSSFTVGGSVSGLQGTGLVLRLNSTTDVAIAPGAASYAFPTPIPSGTQYAVAIATSPASPTQTCTLANATGTVGASNVANVNVVCSTNTYPISGTIAGYAGSGLVLRNGAESLTIPPGATSFAFQTQVASGSSYAVTAPTQPTNPSQVCVVASGTGTVSNAAVTNVAVTCATSAFTVGGTITGLSGSGLVLHNGAENLPVNAGATSFTFATPVQSGTGYAVTIAAQPSGQTCAVSNGSGTVAGGNVTSVSVSCLTASSLTITAASASPATVAAGATVTVTATVRNGGQSTANSVSASIAPPSGFALASGPGPAQNIPGTQTATFTWTFTAQAGATGGTFTVNASGTDAASGAPVAAAPATTNAVTVTYALGGTLSGASARVDLQLTVNGASTTLQLPANGAFTFSQRVPSGATYAVTITRTPPRQSCSIANASGTMPNADVSNIGVTCSDVTYTLTTTVGGTSTGTVTCNGVACGPTQPYAADTLVDVAVTPTAGVSVVAALSVDGGAVACDAFAGCVLPITMSANHSVAVTFDGVAPPP